MKKVKKYVEWSSVVSIRYNELYIYIILSWLRSESIIQRARSKTESNYCVELAFNDRLYGLAYDVIPNINFASANVTQYGV